MEDLTDAAVAVAAAAAGARVVARDFGADHQRHMKGATDFATDTDAEAERAILGVLAGHRPGDGWTGEESGPSGNPTSDRHWLVDPLCGTANFAATTPLVAVNVALREGGRVRVAAVADPMSGETFWTDGATSHLRDGSADRPAVPTAASMLVDINCDGPVDQPFVGGQLVHDPRLRAAFGPRVISSTLAVAWVAVGRRAGYVSDGHVLDSVHFAAGIAICRAAGCVVSDLAGGPLGAGRGLVVSADQRTHDHLLELVGPYLGVC